jgi:hypothetical protein
MLITLKQTEPGGRVRVSVRLNQEESALWEADEKYIERLALHTVFDRARADLALAALVSLRRGIVLQDNDGAPLALIPLSPKRDKSARMDADEDSA